MGAMLTGEADFFTIALRSLPRVVKKTSAFQNSAPFSLAALKSWAEKKQNQKNRRNMKGRFYGFRSLGGIVLVAIVMVGGKVLGQEAPNPGIPAPDLNTNGTPIRILQQCPPCREF
jgi:hypothetical protein